MFMYLLQNDIGFLASSDGGYAIAAGEEMPADLAPISVETVAV
jgi:hypothetical protein